MNALTRPYSGVFRMDSQSMAEVQRVRTFLATLSETSTVRQEVISLENKKMARKIRGSIKQCIRHADALDPEPRTQMLEQLASLEARGMAARPAVTAIPAAMSVAPSTGPDAAAAIEAALAAGTFRPRGPGDLLAMLVHAAVRRAGLTSTGPEPVPGAAAVAGFAPPLRVQASASEGGKHERPFSPFSLAAGTDDPCLDRTCRQTGCFRPSGKTGSGATAHVLLATATPPPPSGPRPRVLLLSKCQPPLQS